MNDFKTAQLLTVTIMKMLQDQSEHVSMQALIAALLMTIEDHSCNQWNGALKILETTQKLEQYWQKAYNIHI